MPQANTRPVAMLHDERRAITTSDPTTTVGTPGPSERVTPHLGAAALFALLLAHAHVLFTRARADASARLRLVVEAHALDQAVARLLGLVTLTKSCDALGQPRTGAEVERIAVPAPVGFSAGRGRLGRSAAL